MLNSSMVVAILMSPFETTLTITAAIPADCSKRIRRRKIVSVVNYWGGAVIRLLRNVSLLGQYSTYSILEITLFVICHEPVNEVPWNTCKCQ